MFIIFKSILLFLTFTSCFHKIRMRISKATHLNFTNYERIVMSDYVICMPIPAMLENTVIVSRFILSSHNVMQVISLVRSWRVLSAYLCKTHNHIVMSESMAVSRWFSLGSLALGIKSSRSLQIMSKTLQHIL